MSTLGDKVVPCHYCNKRPVISIETNKCIIACCNIKCKKNPYVEGKSIEEAIEKWRKMEE